MFTGEVYPSEDKNMMVSSGKMCGSINEKIVEFDLDIVEMTVEPCQIPSQDNGYIAVIKTELSSSTVKFEAVGTSTPESLDGVKDVGKLIDKVN